MIFVSSPDRLSGLSSVKACMAGAGHTGRCIRRGPFSKGPHCPRRLAIVRGPWGAAFARKWITRRTCREGSRASAPSRLPPRYGATVVFCAAESCTLPRGDRVTQDASSNAGGDEGPLPAFAMVRTHPELVVHQRPWSHYVNSDIPTTDLLAARWVRAQSERGPGFVQSSTTRSGTRPNSRVFCVTTIRRLAMAIAAMNRSRSPIGAWRSA